MTRSQLHLRVRPGRRDELLAALDGLAFVVAGREQSGFLAATVLVPEGDLDGVLVEAAWASAEHFERWRESPTRAELLSRLEPLLAEAPLTRVYHAVETVG